MCARGEDLYPQSSIKGYSMTCLSTCLSYDDKSILAPKESILILLQSAG